MPGKRFCLWHFDDIHATRLNVWFLPFSDISVWPLVSPNEPNRTSRPVEKKRETRDKDGQRILATVPQQSIDWAGDRGLAALADGNDQAATNQQCCSCFRHGLTERSEFLEGYEQREPGDPY